MRWSEENYPKELNKVRPELRKKAIDLANTLLDSKKFQESNAINTALYLVKDWEKTWEKSEVKESAKTFTNGSHPSINPGMTGSFYNDFRKTLYLSQQQNELDKSAKGK